MKTLFRSAAAAALMAIAGVATSSAQAVNACYVPNVGAIYLVGLTGLPTACLSASHVAIALGGASLPDGSVTSIKIADAAITRPKLGPQAVGPGNIGPGAVQAGNLAPASVQPGNLAPNAVVTGNLAPNAVGAPQIQLGAVGSAQVADNSLGAIDLANGAVGNTEIANGAVSKSKLASDARVPQGLAAVAGDGTLLRGLNVQSVSHPGTGRYEITFTSAANVAAGFYNVTPGLEGTCAMRISAERGTAANSVFVLFSDGSSFVNCGFSLIVF